MAPNQRPPPLPGHSVPTTSAPASRPGHSLSTPSPSTTAAVGGDACYPGGEALGLHSLGEVPSPLRASCFLQVIYMTFGGISLMGVPCSCALYLFLGPKQSFQNLLRNAWELFLLLFFSSTLN